MTERAARVHARRQAGRRQLPWRADPGDGQSDRRPHYSSCRMAMAMPDWSLTSAGGVGAENVHVDGALDELEPLELASWSSRR